MESMFALREETLRDTMVTPLTPQRELPDSPHQQGNQAENSQFLCDLNFFIEISI